MIRATDRLHLSELIGQAQSEQGVNADLNHIDITAITDLSHLFFNTVFNGDISCWDTSRVTNMEKMFADSSFNGDISRWDTSKVESMNSMFQDSKFNGDISLWNTSKAKDMRATFCWSVFNGDLSQCATCVVVSTVSKGGGCSKNRVLYEEPLKVLHDNSKL